MADFSFLSDTDDSAVEDLISQTRELCVLEQVAAVNCSGFTDSLLPSDLETRFRKLKSFPAAKSKPKKVSRLDSAKPNFDSGKKMKKPEEEEGGKRDSDSETEIFSASKQNPVGKTPPNPQRRSESASSPSDFSISGPKLSDPKPEEAERESDSESGAESEIFSPSKQNPAGKTPPKRSESASRSSKLSPLEKTPNGKKGAKKDLEQKRRTKSRSLSSSSSDSPNSSPSPPRSTGCLWCSPKKSSGKKKNKKKGQNRVLGGADFDWGSDDEFLSDLGVFSEKERRKILKKSMKEEEKINREAEKIVKWAKQVSARMSASASTNQLHADDDESTK